MQRNSAYQPSPWKQLRHIVCLGLVVHLGEKETQGSFGEQGGKDLMRYKGNDNTYVFKGSNSMFSHA